MSPIRGSIVIHPALPDIILDKGGSALTVQNTSLLQNEINYYRKISFIVQALCHSVTLTGCFVS